MLQTYSIRRRIEIHEQEISIRAISISFYRKDLVQQCVTLRRHTSQHRRMSGESL